MAGKGLAMAKVSEIKRYIGLGMKNRAIARALKVDRRTVADIRKGKSDTQEQSEASVKAEGWSDILKWDEVIAELTSGVPIQIIWEDLRDDGKVPVQYPGFWKQLKRRHPNLPLTMVRLFAPGERAEIDYCDGIDLFDPITQEIIKTHLFVGVLCHSRYAFAEFSLSQSSLNFLSSHVRMFEWFCGVTQLLSPDNLKSAITNVHKYDPVVNPAYTKLAEYYGTAVVPARVAKPRDKAIVERTIQIFQRWFFFKVRRRTFTSLAELNHCLKEHLELFNSKKHRIFRRSRREMFLNEQPHLIPLPAQPYIVATHATAKLHTDCHFSFDKNYYSAPHGHRGKVLDIWATQSCIDVYIDGDRIAFHSRLHAHGKFKTDKDHYPESHQAYHETTPKYLRDQAAKLGYETSKLIHELLSGPYPLQHLRRAQGIIRLAKKYGQERLNKAIGQAALFNQKSYQAIERLLKNESLWANKATEKPIKRGENKYLRGEEILH